MENTTFKQPNGIIEPNPKANVIPLDPIAAIATPIGEGAISIVRISGRGALDIADRAFRKIGGKKKFPSLKGVYSHSAHYGHIVNKYGQVVDEVLAIVYQMPKSYTAEDMVEFNCHGGVIVTENVLQTLIDAGCRLAEPGEFTRRAFLNSRVDLIQAEAIGEMIHASSQAAYRASMIQLKGDLSKKLEFLREQLLNCASMLELELDFSEEDVRFQSREDLKVKVQNLISELEELEASFRFGKTVKDGVVTAIVGRPNSGKSTLLNALVGRDRAIVSPQAGTTRDFIEDTFSHEGVFFKVIDTAGLHETKDAVETEGIKRSYEKVDEASIIVYVLDASQKLSTKEIEEIFELKERNPNATFVAVANKMDMMSELANKKIDFTLPEIRHEIEQLTKRFSEKINSEVVLISAAKRNGIKELKKILKRMAVGNEKLAEGSVVITNTRHFEAVKNALVSLNAAKDLLRKNKSSELVASEVRLALFHVGSITGKVTTEDILNNIFAKFCIGK
jgi:tRNA modification GTPase